MRAIVTVIGKDKKGIIASVSAYLSEIDANIEDISQTLMQGNFVMIMLVDLSETKLTISEVSDGLKAIETQKGVSIHIQREEIFQAMHRI